jgi:prepilin-type N-terminal cleavage/methylation domain-containing protein/prepilin-type processing-associated H-X9-DG protein
MRSVHTNNRKGFTLIEILIVVAMLALLAALLFAVVGRVRENGRRAVCLSNVKQMSLGLLQYLQDNDSRFPIVPLPEVALRSYVKADKVFKCPSVPPQYSGQYLIPQWLLEVSLKAKTVNGRHEATIANTSTTMSIFELIGDDEEHQEVASSCTTDHQIGVRHLGGANYAFVDGHVEWMSSSEYAAFLCSTLVPSLPSSD